MDTTYRHDSKHFTDITHLPSLQTYRVKVTESLTYTVLNKMGDMWGHTNEQSFRQGFVQARKTSLFPFLCSAAQYDPGPSSELIFSYMCIYIYVLVSRLNCKQEKPI